MPPSNTKALSVRTEDFAFVDLFFDSVLYRAHGLQVDDVLLNGQNLECLFTGQLNNQTVSIGHSTLQEWA